MRVMWENLSMPDERETSRLCSGQVFQSNINRLHHLVEWVNPGVAAVYKEGHTDSLREKRVGSLVLKAEINRGQYSNLPPDVTGVWLRKITLLDINGYARLNMHTPMKSKTRIRPDLLAFFLHLCSNTNTSAYTNDLLDTYLYANDMTNVGTATATMYNMIGNQNVTNTEVSVGIGRLFADSISSLVDVACESIMQVAVHRSDEDLLLRVARIKNHTRIGASLSDVGSINLMELNSIGLTFARRHENPFTLD